VAVEVTFRGLKEVGTAFRQVDRELPIELKLSFRAIVTKVIGHAQSRIPHITGRAAASLKPRATQKGAAIAFGGTAAPYYPWLDFGGRVGRNRSISRPFIKEGRYVYPTIRADREMIIKDVEDAVEHTAEKAGFETRG